MKRLILPIVSALSALCLTGCFQNETTIHLNKDGSGKLVEETRLGAQMLEMFAQMAAFGGEENAAQDPLKEMFSEEKAKKRAAELGEGVTFEKSEPIEANGSKGARVTYQFKDINKLKVSSGDSMKNMSPMAEAQIEQADKPEPVTFQYADGKLTIKVPDVDKGAKDADAGDAEAAADDADADAGQNPEMEAMMKQMLGDMKVSLKLVVEDGISATDATHRDGNTITLMEMNMGKVIENADAFKKLTAVDQDDPAAAMEALKGVDGVKIETKPEVQVTLK